MSEHTFNQSDRPGRRESPAVYRRRRLLASGVATVAIGTAAWTASEVVDFVKHHDDPLPAACETTLRPGQDRWEIAEQISQHLNGAHVGVIDYNLDRANPGADTVMQPGPIGVPKAYCDVVNQPGFNKK